LINACINETGQFAYFRSLLSFSCPWPDQGSDRRTQPVRQAYCLRKAYGFRQACGLQEAYGLEASGICRSVPCRADKSAWDIIITDWKFTDRLHSTYIENSTADRPNIFIRHKQSQLSINTYSILSNSLFLCIYRRRSKFRDNSMAVNNLTFLTISLF